MAFRSPPQPFTTGEAMSDHRPRRWPGIAPRDKSPPERLPWAAASSPGAGQRERTRPPALLPLSAISPSPRPGSGTSRTASPARSPSRRSTFVQVFLAAAWNFWAIARQQAAWLTAIRWRPSWIRRMAAAISSAALASATTSSSGSRRQHFRGRPTGPPVRQCVGHGHVHPRPGLHRPQVGGDVRCTLAGGHCRHAIGR